jgi:predicted nucleotidyltransferase
MTDTMKEMLSNYIVELQRIYGKYLQSVILYGSYARGDYSDSSDVDIMILLNLTEEEIKGYRHRLSEYTYDFYMTYDIDIKPIAKSREHFMKWVENYPFYSNVNREGVKLFEAA